MCSFLRVGLNAAFLCRSDRMECAMIWLLRIPVRSTYSRCSSHEQFPSFVPFWMRPIEARINRICMHVLANCHYRGVNSRVLAAPMCPRHVC